MLNQEDLDAKGLKVTLLAHPLVKHKLTLMRDKNLSSAVFRMLLREISWLLCFEVTKDLPLEMRAVETPVAPMEGPVLSGKKLVD